MDFLYYVSIAKYLALYTALYYLLGLGFILKIQTYSYIRRENYKIVNDILPIITLFVVFSFCDGDNFHYIKWFYAANNGGRIEETAVQEPFYQLLSYYINGNYFVFRLITWGGALLIFSLTSMRLKVSPRVSLICLYCLFLFIFSYARASLGMCVYFWGFSFLIKPIKAHRIFSYLFGILLTASSMLFHTSMAILVLLTIPVLCAPIFRDKKTAIIKFLVYIIGLVVLMATVTVTIEELLESSEIPMLSKKLLSYTDKDEKTVSIINSLIESWLTIIMFLCLYFSRKSLYTSKSNNYLTDKIFLLSSTIFVIGLTLSFMGPAYAIISYRIKYMSIVPTSLLVAYCATKGCLSYRKFLLLQYLGVSLILFRMIVFVYLTSKGLGINMDQNL